MDELRDRAVIVTGAGQGLGRAYALAVTGAGGNVVVNDRNGLAAQAVADEIKAAGGLAVASAEPVGTAAAAERLVRLCTTTFGAVHGLINNAARHAQGPSGSHLPEDMERLFGTNVLGTWHTGQAAVAAMQRQGTGGVVINVISGAMLGSPDLAAYGASKAAIQSLTVSWALELKHSGIRVMAISPLARTAMLLGTTGRSAECGPEVAAPLAVYLLSDRSVHLNGQTVRIADGEVSLYTPGSFGPVLGSSQDWTVSSLGEILDSAKGSVLTPVERGAANGGEAP